jgi:phenylpyruvate tautomerase PptA (4-oxalocrotonate tautomerase family)
MPILDIEIIASGSELNLPPSLAQSLADEVAKVFGGSQGTVWVKLRVMPSALYAEDHGKPQGVYPVFVTVLKARRPEGDALEDEISRLTGVFAKVLERPEENIHIFYQPDAAGRVAFGGRLVR